MSLLRPLVLRCSSNAVEDSDWDSDSDLNFALLPLGIDSQMVFPFAFLLFACAAAASHSPVGGAGGRIVIVVVADDVVVGFRNCQSSLLFTCSACTGVVAIVVVCVVLFLFYISGIVLTIWCFLL